MASYLVRTTFLSLVALAIAAQATRLAGSTAPDANSTLEQNIRTLGLGILPSDNPHLLTISAPGCAQPLQLTTVQFDGTQSAVARYLLSLPGEPRFIYLGFVGQTPDPLQIAMRWGAGTALHVLGIHQSRAPKGLLLVTIPSSCLDLKKLDWARLSPWS